MSEAPDIGTIIEALEQYTRGDEHQRAIEAAIAVLRTVESRESALIAERDALRVVAIEQSALLGELSKGLFPDDDLFAQIVEVGAKLDALSSPAVEGVMGAGDYTHIPTPEGIALDLCPCCGSKADVWQYIEEDESASKAAMCTNGAAFGPQDGAADEGCPLNMPPQGFYRATIREAVAYWNEYAKALTKQQRENRWKAAQVLRAENQKAAP